MARAQRNSALTALSGKLDGYVYKTFKNGKSFLSKMPATNPDQVLSAGTRAGNDRLRRGVAYAKTVLADPECAAFYHKLTKKKKAWRSFNVATADFMNPPKITKIDLAHYNGRAGGWIRVHAEDDVEVIGIRVEIRDLTGRIWEYGLAGDDPNGGWRYWATQDIPAETELEIEVGADDRPGNRTIARRTLRVSRMSALH